MPFIQGVKVTSFRTQFLDTFEGTSEFTLCTQNINTSIDCRRWHQLIPPIDELSNLLLFQTSCGVQVALTMPVQEFPEIIILSEQISSQSVLWFGSLVGYCSWDSLQFIWRCSSVVSDHELNFLPSLHWSIWERSMHQKCTATFVCFVKCRVWFGLGRTQKTTQSLS